MADVCPICKRDLKSEKTVIVGEKGLNNLFKFSVQRGDGLRVRLKGAKEVTLHEACRKNYTRRMSSDENIFVSPPPKQLLRSSADQNFNFRGACFLCGKGVSLSTKGMP